MSFFNSPTLPAKPFPGASELLGRYAPKSRKNGFRDPSWPTSQDLERDPAGLEVALNKHRLAQFVLTQQDRPIPSLDEMRAEVAKPEDAQFIKDRLAEVKAQHLVDLRRLYDAQAGDYIDDALDKYYSKDDMIKVMEGSDPTYSQPEQMYNCKIRASISQHAWTDAWEYVRWSHVSQLNHLLSQKTKIDKEEEEARKRFPTSSVDFQTKNKDMQLRVANFLTGDEGKRDRMMSEFSWAWRQVKPLIDEFNEDVGPCLLEERESSLMRFIYSRCLRLK
ncbi:hypothetical protein BDN72DRAFT_757345 [Pluteus cervinus]|uniref:Uncharacterized protein n=1 Tax=Pluteus cervinus TaxID=181527 RepID=A0ACD3BCL4_9AGAR|nr:hypothetical protein BDN72DRAFT_757345 [Pluteus cervinus]